MSLQKHNKKKFSELIQKNQKIIHKIAMIYTNSSVEREDLFQEICLQLWRSYSNFREEAQFSTWIYRIALNTAISTIRKKNKYSDFEPIKESLLPAETTEDTENVKMLYLAISKLNNIDKALILLWLEDKSYNVIATVLGITRSNVSVKLVRIKRKLEELVNESVKLES